MSLVSNLACKPTVFTPSQEAAISIEEECPEIENESNEFKHESLVVEHDMKRKRSNVQDPDEYISARFAESKEY